MNRPMPYGEDQEPYWRTHDSSLRHEEKPHPEHAPRPAGRMDPDWDESHWFNGEHLWLDPHQHRPGLWHSLKLLLGFARKEKVYSDSIVADEVCEALAHEPEVDVADIDVTVKEGHVTLEGRAPDLWTKQQAEDVVYFLPGVSGVTNNIHVRAA